PGAFGPLYTFGYMPRAWTVTFVGAAILWLCAYWGTRWTTLLPGLWAGLIAALAPVVVGQLLVGPNHDIGSDAGALQTLAAGPRRCGCSGAGGRRRCPYRGGGCSARAWSAPASCSPRS